MNRLSSHPVALFMSRRQLALAVVSALALLTGCALETPSPPPVAQAVVPSADSARIVAEAPASAWRPLRPEDTVYLETPAGRVVIELAPRFAPAHVARVKALVQAGQFSGQAISRVQDNYVVQWGDGAHVPDFAKAPLPDEWSVSPYPPGVSFTALPDGDVYAPVVGHADGLPVARDPSGKGADEAWPAHCYGMVGVGRDAPPDNGNGAELYVVTGHAPRHLDRNVILIGRVVQGMEKLSSLPRGTGALGVYEKPEQKIPLVGSGMRMAADVPAAEQSELEILRTDTPTWAAFVDAKRHRQGGWYATPVNKIELCNVPLPVRQKPAPKPSS